MTYFKPWFSSSQGFCRCDVLRRALARRRRCLGRGAALGCESSLPAGLDRLARPLARAAFSLPATAPSVRKSERRRGCTLTPPHNPRKAAGSSHCRANSRADPLPRTQAYHHSATHRCGSVASRPATPSRALRGAQNLDPSRCSTTSAMRHTACPADTRSSAPCATQALCRRSGRRRTAPALSATPARLGPDAPAIPS